MTMTKILTGGNEMTKLMTSLMTAGIALGSVALLGAPAMAQSATGPSLSANVAVVSDYRFRGVSQSDEDPALQGGLDVGYQGFYVGTWGSSIQENRGAETEFDLYGGWGTTFANDMAFDVGFLYYTYPDGNNTNYYEFYTSVSGKVQQLEWKLGANYSPDQNNLGDDDDLYLQGSVKYTLPNSPIYVAAHGGWENGALADPDLSGGNNKIDWSASIGVTWQAWDVSVSYVDTDQHCNACDATAVFSIGASF